jgi:hypothetical protein
MYERLKMHEDRREPEHIAAGRKVSTPRLSAQL